MTNLSRDALNIRRVERLAVIGVSHSRGGPEAVAAFQACYRGPLDVARLGFPEAVVVATCNRFEAVVALPPGMSARSARAALPPADGRYEPAFAFAGDAAVERLMRVAASLDSMNPGEDQVMRQVRRAYAEAQARGTTGRLTSFAFEQALKAAKRVRREVPLAPLNTSLFTLALPRLRELLRPGDGVAVLGAGEMGRAAAVALARAGLGLDLLVVNRDAVRGGALAEEVGGRWAPLDAFLGEPPAVAAVVCATPRRDLLSAPVLAAMPDLRVAVDLGTPPNVDAGAARSLGVEVIGHAELEAAGRRRRERLAARLARAEAVVLEELDAALEAWTERELAPAIGRLRAHYVDTIRGLVAPGDAERLASRFARAPLKGLRELAKRYGVGAAEAFVAAMEEK